MVATNLCARNLLKYSYPSFLSATVSVDIPDLSRLPTTKLPPSAAAVLYLVAVLPVNRPLKAPAAKPNLVSILDFILVSIPPTVVNPVAFFTLNTITSSECILIFVPLFI